MAFIVPVVRKDFNLYGQRKQSVTLAKPGRSNSTPIRIVSVGKFENLNVLNYVSLLLESLERNLAARQAFQAKRLRQTSASVSAPDSPAQVGQRRHSRRISIRHFHSADSTESSTTTDSSKRRVHFGHCEEIEFESEEEEQQQEEVPQRNVQKRPTINKRTSVPNDKFPNKSQYGARPRSVSLMEIEPINLESRQASTLATILRLAKLARPGN
jgi:hypothetical protein